MRPTIDPVRKRMSVGGQSAAATVAPRASVSAEVSVDALLKSLEGEVIDFVTEANGVCLRSKTDKELGRKSAFGEKDRSVEGAASTTSLSEELNSIGTGVVCKKGMKPGSPNQDSFSMVIADQAFKIFAVFDGHGPKGHDVSDFAAENLLKLFIRHKDRKVDPETAITDSFVDVQRMIEAFSRTGKMAANDSGCTATIAYLPAGESAAWIAHIGDSRAAIGKVGSKAGSVVPQEITEDHKPDLPREKARIEKAGGIVVFDGYFNHRIYSTDGKGGLNMSRAFGDCAVHKFGVTAVPDCRRLQLKVSASPVEAGHDLFLLLCSDGVWEFMKSEDVCRIIQQHGRGGAQEAAEEIAKMSYDLWMDDSEGEVSDDITVILVWL